MKDCNMDCTYWQEGEGKCKILTYDDCPNNCKWKLTSDERKAKLKKANARLQKMGRSLNLKDRETVKHIMAKYYGKRTKIRGIKPIIKQDETK